MTIARAATRSTILGGTDMMAAFTCETADARGKLLTVLVHSTAAAGPSITSSQRPNSKLRIDALMGFPTLICKSLAAAH